MKKILFLTLILGAIISNGVNAQGSAPTNTPPDPAVMLQKMKETTVPGLVEKAGLTTEQANKLVELHFEMRMAASALPNDADRAKKIEELKVAKEKKIAELLTPDQIAAANAYYAERGKEMQKKGN